MILEKLLAHIEDAPGVGVGIPVEQPGAVLDLRLRHHRVEPGPGVDIAADQRGLAVGMLQQHRDDVLFRHAGASSARTRKMCGSVPRVTATRLPLRSATVLILESFVVTNAVHSGREYT